MVRAKVGSREYEQKVLDVLHTAKAPLDVTNIAHKLGVGFGTARAILLDMALAGKLEKITTVHGSLYQLPNKNGEKENDSVQRDFET